MSLIAPGGGENELAELVIGCAMAAHSELRPGLDEKLYENAMCIEFSERGIGFDQQKNYAVHYHGKFIGRLIPDLIVADKLIVDLKVVDSFLDQHVAQMLGYLSITGLRVGLLLNFKHSSLQVKRVIAPTRSAKLNPPPDSPPEGHE